MEENQFMASVVVTRNGERVICILREVFTAPEGDPERKGECYLLIHPYSLTLEQVPVEDRVETQVRFEKWNPFATDIQFKVPYEHLVAIGVADPNLAQAYKGKVEFVEQQMAAAQQPPTTLDEDIEKVEDAVPAEV